MSPSNIAAENGFLQANRPNAWFNAQMDMSGNPTIWPSNLCNGNFPDADLSGAGDTNQLFPQVRSGGLLCVVVYSKW